jgi:ABC-type dipeptide/oligopeptide/nickel transport system permease subunit
MSAVTAQTISGEAASAVLRARPSALAAFSQALRRRKPAAAAAVILAVIVVSALAAPVLAPYDPLEMHGRARFQGPSTTYWLGTDETGRDLLSRMLYAARVSVLVGLGSVAITFVLGIPLGLTAGYRGGRTEDVIMRVMDVLLAVPGLLLALMLVATFGPSTVNATLAIGLMSVPGVARLTRAVVLSEKGRDYVLAARAMGASHARIALRAIFPNCIPPLIVQASLTMANAILIEAALSYIGLGVQPPWSSLGSLLYTAYGFISRSQWYVTFPGLVIFLVVWSLNLLGDGLRDAVDPRLRGIS